MADGVLPNLPIHVDSPLAEEISLVYQEYPDSVPGSSGEDVRVDFLQSQDEARQRSTQQDPCIIVASGGMCEGKAESCITSATTSMHPRSSIVLVSYQAPAVAGAAMMLERSADGVLPRAKVEQVGRGGRSERFLRTRRSRPTSRQLARLGRRTDRPREAGAWRAGAKKSEAAGQDADRHGL